MARTQKNTSEFYQLKIQALEEQLRTTQKRIDQLSLVRIGLFLLEILFFILLLRSADDNSRTLIIFMLIIPVFCFAFVVKKQSLLDKEVSALKRLLWVFQNEFSMLQNGANGYEHGNRFESESHPYSSDLDIFGAFSLYALTNRCSTKGGQELLARAFSTPALREAIIEKQEAVREILSGIENAFPFRAKLQGHPENELEKIKTQLETQLGNQLTFVRSVYLKIYVKLAPFVCLSLALAGLFLNPAYWTILIFVLVLQSGLVVLLTPKINLVFYTFGGQSLLLNDYASAIEWMEAPDWKSKYIQDLFHSKISVSKEIKSLAGIIKSFEARLNMIVGGILNGLLLWDIRCCIRLNTWYNDSSGGVVEALERIGQFEELISIATLAYNNPDWIFPELQEEFKLNASAVGHPLIAPETRVVNDFNLKNDPTVDVITGSNMAGKSTFLRTLGINMVLAYAGAPVCALNMQLSVFRLNTYMRIKDALNESTSTFKAELNRLKMILDHVKTDKNTFVLIDEMLRGTNSRDKYLGSKVFIQKLIAEATPALFATHDLQLSEMSKEYPEKLRNFHFDIQIQEGEMKFDYKIKAGPCTTFNASILLKEIGLSLDNQELISGGD